MSQPAPPSTWEYLASTPTVIATISRFVFNGSPHPQLSLQDLIQAALFKRLYGSRLMPKNDQSDMSTRMALKFAQSVEVRAELLSPLEAKYYAGELSHLSVSPTQVPAFFLTPKKQLKPGKIILYIHGGGYGLGDATGGGIANALANKLGRMVCTIDYRLGFTAPFPAAVQDCITAYFHLRKTYEARSIVLAGDSAGGGLVLATLLHLRELADLPSSAILFSPLIQTNNSDAESFRKFDAVDFISTDGLPLVTKGYTSLCPNSRYIQLFDNSYRGLPPLFVSYGDAEILSDDDREFCHRARQDGVEVIEEVGSGKVHVWIALPQEQKNARQVWANMKVFVDGEAAKL